MMCMGCGSVVIDGACIDCESRATGFDIEAYVRAASPVYKSVIVRWHNDPNWICQDVWQALRMITSAAKNVGIEKLDIKILGDGIIYVSGGGNGYFWKIVPFDPEVRGWARELGVA